MLVQAGERCSQADGVSPTASGHVLTNQGGFGLGGGGHCGGLLKVGRTLGNLRRKIGAERVGTLRGVGYWLESV